MRVIKYLDIRGSSVINGEGEAKGSVLDCIFDRRSRRITALVVMNKTPLVHYYILRFIDIKNLGDNLMTEEKLYPLKKSIITKNKAIRFGSYVDKAVIDDNGDEVGEIKDAIIEEGTGAIKAIICTRGFVEDMMGGRRVFLVDKETKFGLDKIIIKNCTMNIYNEMSIWKLTKG